MGILAENLLWLLEHAPAPRSLLELGNQILYIPRKPFPEYPDRFLNLEMAGATRDGAVAAKPFFQDRGYAHTSIDLNGLDGALPLDLDTRLDLNRTFDLATDFGTSEHVVNLWQCLENLHRHVRPGGLLAHVNPLPGHWPGHGYWYRDETFYQEFCQLSGYKLLDLRRASSLQNEKDGWNMWALLERPEQAFPSQETFRQLPLKTA